MSTTNLREVLYYAQGVDFDRQTLAAAKAELAAHVAAVAALRRLLHAFPPVASDEESAAVHEAHKALGALKDVTP